MSRLTANPFQRPPMFQFPQRVPAGTGLQSPPDTEPVPPNLSMSTANASVAVGLDTLRFPEPEPHAYAEPPRPRKGPTLSYYNSGIREARERTVQRSIKSFIVVLPPPSLIDEHGPLGHTLSTGPRHRLRDGILLPLFPTIFGQLTAIAKEFNFPSTAGLCLYLHIHENGITMTPRISDDAWPLVWSHAFDASSHGGRLPIAGKVEFDIDFTQARWFRLWVSGSHREQEIPFMMDMPPSTIDGPVSSPPRQHDHSRHESRTTSVGDQGSQAATQSQAPTLSKRVSHVPRKLSLVERYDFPTSQPQSRTPSRPTLSPTRELSPILQEDEPQSALERKVRKWRARTSAVLPSPLGVNDAGNAAEEAPKHEEAGDEEDEVSELNLEDYAWSISSYGPPDYDQQMSLYGSLRVPSVHIAARAQGSVMLTPTTATSWGALNLPSPAPTRSRIDTPDIAMRHLEDCPPTPTTATSWGPPSEWPASPMYQQATYRTPSVDLAQRMMGSRPCTPTTATSWGPNSYPVSPVEGYASYPRSPSIHLAYRGDFSRPVTPMTATSWGAPSEYPPSPAARSYCPSVHLADRGEFSHPVTPMTATSWGAPSWPASPMYQDGIQQERIDTPDAAQIAFDFDVERGVKRAVRKPLPLDEYPQNLYNIYPAVQARAVIPAQLQVTVESPRVQVTVDSPRVHERELAQPSPVKGTPWNQVWPYTKATSVSESVSDYAENEVEDMPPTKLEQTPSKPLSFPYYDAFAAKPWDHVWPYTQAYPGNLANGIYPPVSQARDDAEPSFGDITVASEAHDEEVDLHSVYDSESSEDFVMTRPNPFAGIKIEVATEVHDDEEAHHAVYNSDAGSAHEEEDLRSVYDSEEDEDRYVQRPNPFAGIQIQVATVVHDDAAEEVVEKHVEEVVEEHAEEDALSVYDSEEDEEHFAPRPNPFAGIKIEVATEVHEDQTEAPAEQDEEEALSVYDSEEDEDPFRQRPNPFAGIQIQVATEVHEDPFEDPVGQHEEEDVHSEYDSAEEDEDIFVQRPNPFAGITISVATEIHEDPVPQVVQKHVEKAVGERAATPMTFPYYDAFKAAPWQQVWPYTQAYPGNLSNGIYPHAPTEAEVAPEIPDEEDDRELPPPRGIMISVNTESQIISEVEEPEEDPSSPMSFASYDVRRGESWDDELPSYNQIGETVQIPTIQITSESDYDHEEEPPTPMSFSEVEAFPDTPWRQVWPYTRAGEFASPAVQPQAGSYPFICIYAPVYPHFDLYPTPAAQVLAHVSGSSSSATRKSVKARRTHAQLHATFIHESATLSQPNAARKARRSHADLHNIVMREQNVMSTKARTFPAVTSAGYYPNLSLYAPVYPHFDLYPAPAARMPARARPMSRRVRISTSPIGPPPMGPLPPAPSSRPGSMASSRTNSVSSLSQSPISRSSISRSNSPRFSRTASPIEMRTSPIEARASSPLTTHSSSPSTSSTTKSSSPLKQRSLSPPQPARHRLTHSELHAMVMLEMRMAEMTRDAPPLPRDAAKLTSGSARLSMLRSGAGPSLPASPRPLSRAVSDRRSEYIGRVDGLRSRFAERENANNLSSNRMSLAEGTMNKGHIARASSMRETPSFRRGDLEGKLGAAAPLRSSSSISRRMEMLQEAASKPARSSVIMEEDRGFPRRRQSEVPTLRDLSRFPMPPAPPMPSGQRPFGSF
ncbi:hypothetical protein K523DRAFT_371858 [Schizophyllum commune Tattone D]|nr:hypothetical protein K523DRAFT_371858 [Schizophyllum commune Tattone D]